MLKRLPLFFFCFFIAMHAMAQQTIWVSSTGNNDHDGSQANPLQSLQAAIRKARNMHRLGDTNTINIHLTKGFYTITETIVLRPEDSHLQIMGDNAAETILSGGIRITGWKKLLQPVAGLSRAIQQQIWVADVPTVNGNDFLFRQLWVNDVKAIRAKDTKGELMNRIISWNKKEETCFIPTPKFNLQNVVGAEMFIHQWWAIANLRIKKFEQHGDSTKLFFHQPESKIQSEHPWPAPWISKETGNSAFYLTNAIQFLDEPGEWFLDKQNHKLYYYPRSNEDVRTATVMASNVETLVSFEGTSTAPVSNVFFKGISFQHTGWLRPSLQGHVPHQAGLYMTEAYKLKPAGTKEKPTLDNQAWIGRPAAAVELRYTNEIYIVRCSFQHFASTGIDSKMGVKKLLIEGCLFKDIGGNAILGGNYGDEGREIHLSYVNKNETDICEEINISNNLITDVTNEDWGTVGIGLGIVRKTWVTHNEIENIGYSGISLGWGWNATKTIAGDNTIRYNKIHHYGKHNYDCAGIYTLGNQPNTTVASNYVDSIYKAAYAHLPSHWFYLYADEGSSNIKFLNNLTPSTKFLQNQNGEGNRWLNNGPSAYANLKLIAGLENEYASLLKERTSRLVRQAINQEHSEVIELVVKESRTLDLPKLKLLLSNNNMDSTAIYQWQNHYVIFDKVVDIAVMQGRLQNNFPEVEVKVYHDMFYEYSKKKHCTDTTTARAWEHIILTTNLVADTKLQQEYLDYHTTQFEQWKEVSNGFCNANFQQLLIFKNGRQLVLVISIPKGESLDKLNPKTIENNPRVNDWNKIMGKYQEGIKGTKKGETWVFLKNLN